MAHIDFLRDCMADALRRMDDKDRPFEERRAARSMFWCLEKRIGTLERSGREEDNPEDWNPVTPDGWPLLGYSEIGFSSPQALRADPTPDEQRRAYLDRKAEVERSARERL